MVLRLRRFLNGLFLFLLILIPLLWWGSSLVISLNATRIAQTLETELGPGFEVGAVRGDLVQGVIITGCAIAPDPSITDLTDPVIQAAECQIRLDWFQLLGGRPAISHVAFRDVQIELQRSATGELLWPAFIRRASMAQGATLALEAFTWSVDRANLTYHATQLDARPVLIDLPRAAGAYDPGEQFQLSECRGSIAGSAWTLKGSVSLGAERTLNGLWRLDEAGIWTLAQALTGGGAGTPAQLDSAAIPAGLVSGSLNIGGTLTDPKLSGHLDWKEGAIRHFQVEQGSLQLEWRPGLLTLKESALEAYSGRIAATGSIDFRQLPPRYDFTAESNQIELGTFLADAGYGKLALSGKFAGAFRGQGSLASIDAFSGVGQVSAANGETLNPLADPALPEIPKKLKYKTLTTDLEIANRQVTLTNTTMDATEVTLEGAGTVSFDGDLNLRGILRAPAGLYVNHPTYGPTIRMLEVENQVVPLQLVVRGTLAQPQTASSVNPADLQNLARQGIMGKLKDFFQGGQQPADN